MNKLIHLEGMDSVLELFKIFKRSVHQQTENYPIGQPRLYQLLKRGRYLKE